MARRSVQEMAAVVGPVANFIRTKRKELGYSQEQFAERVGVGKRFLQELERGKATLRMDKVNQVLEFLGAELGVAPITQRRGNDES